MKKFSLIIIILLMMFSTGFILAACSNEDVREWSVWVETTAPTCTTTGDETRICLRNSSYIETRSIPALGHDFSIWTQTAAPTCIAAGTDTRICNRCSTTETRTGAPAIGHDYGQWHTTLAPTCLEAGTKELRCTKSNTVIDTETIAPLGHDFGSWTEITAPTCTTDGVETRSCNRCSTTETRTGAPATGHDEGSWHIVLTPTCIESGKHELRCNTSQTVLRSETLAPLGHDFGSWAQTTAPTCLTEGIETKICSRCGTIETQQIAALGHDFSQWTEITAPTCTTDGVETRTCNRCSTTETRVGSLALGHDFGSWAQTVAPTCLANGIDSRECSLCQTTETRTGALALGHDEGAWHIVIPPACLSAGFRELRCTRCATVLNTEPLSALGHNFGEWSQTTPPTCTVAGIETRICLRCGTIESRPGEPASGHSFGEWQTHTAATFSRPERQIRICANNPSHTEFRDYAPSVMLGVNSSDVVLNNNTATWFMLELEYETRIQLGLMRPTNAGSFQADLHSSTFARLVFTTVGQTGHVGIINLEAGRYFIRLSFFESTPMQATGRIRVDDFDVLLASAPTLALNTPSPTMTVDTIGQWFRINLNQETLVQLETDGGSPRPFATIFSENNFSHSASLLDSSPFTPNTIRLPQGVYFLRKSTNVIWAGSMGLELSTGTAMLTDLSAELSAAPSIILGTATPTASLNSQGIWYRLVLTQELPLRFIFTEPQFSSALGVDVHLNDSNLTRLGGHRANAGRTHAITLPAGIFYLRLFFNSSGTDSTEGSLTVIDLRPTLTAATVLNLGVPSNQFTITNRCDGVWFRFTITQETTLNRILTVISPVNGLFSANVFSSSNLLNSITFIAGQATLPAGDFFIHIIGHVAGQAGTPITGTVTLNAA